MTGKLVQRLLHTAALVLFFVAGCNKFEEPGLIYDPNKANNTSSPVITSVIPAGSAIAGVREITILGQNFKAGDTTWVYIGNQSPMIKTLTDTKIVVYRPPNYGNSLDIKVVVPSAIAVAKVSNYNVEMPISDVPIFNSPPQFSVIEADRYGSFWICAPRAIYRVTPDFLFATAFMDRTKLNARFTAFADMKFGRGGYLYLLAGLRYDYTTTRTEIFRVDPADSTKAVEVYATLPSSTARLDFDEGGNIYTGGTDGVYFVNTSGTITPTGRYAGVTITEIRVYKDSLYVSDAKNVWKNSISPGGAVGAPQPVVNLNNLPALATCSITSFNLDTDGNVYLCLHGHPQYCVFVLESDGSVTPFYLDNIIPDLVDQLVWAYNSRYLYLNRSISLVGAGSRVYRMGMEKPGATNYGRDL
jgi:hypothetical protein